MLVLGGDFLFATDRNEGDTPPGGGRGAHVYSLSKVEGVGTQDRSRAVYICSPKPQLLDVRFIRSASSVSIDFSAIEYVLATENDLEGILSLYVGFDKEDRRHLLVLPEDQRVVFFQDEIAQGRVFVARDTKRNHTIIGFCRVYIVRQYNELNNILSQELCAISANNTVVPHVMANKFNISLADSQSRAPLRTVSTRSVFPFSLNQSALNCSNNVWIYFGTNYIAHAYRGHGVDTLMERAALLSISNKVKNALAAKWPHSATLYYMYGMIDPAPSEQLSQGRIRSFAWFIHTVFNVRYLGKPIPFSFHAFQAYKPVLEVALPTRGSPHRSLLRHQSFGRLSSTVLDQMDMDNDSFPDKEVKEVTTRVITPEEVIESEISGKGCFVGFDFEYAHEQCMGRIKE